MELVDDVLLNDGEIVELLVEMTRQQQDCVFQLARAALQRPFAKSIDHHAGADGDRGDQKHAAQDQRTDRIALGPRVRNSQVDFRRGAARGGTAFCYCPSHGLAPMG
jgi:hypothetical protein